MTDTSHMMAAETDYPRDFLGYGANPPDPQWPNGAKLALSFVLNYEEGKCCSGIEIDIGGPDLPLV